MYLGLKVMSRLPVFGCVKTAVMVRVFLWWPAYIAARPAAQPTPIGAPNRTQKAVLPARVSIVCRPLLRPWRMPTRYRKLGRADLAAAHRLSLAVGRPHRLEDWRFAQRLGTGHVALDDGAIVGTILTWKHD